MRAAAIATALILGAIAWACSSFDDAEPAAAADAGAGADAATSDGEIDGGTDAGTCLAAEPEWATPSSPVTTATCDGVAAVDLLTARAHCGRCDHSCGGDDCVDGRCVQRQEDATFSVPYRVFDGAVYYARRPYGQGHEIARLVPGTAPVMLGKLEGDAGDDSEILWLDVSNDAVLVRTKTALRKTSTTLASAAPPELIAPLTSEYAASVTATPDGPLVTAQTQKRIDRAQMDGGVTPYLTSVAYPLEATFAGTRYFWLSQPFGFPFGSGPSTLRAREGNADQLLLESSSKLGGLVVDGNEAIVMRAAVDGAIVSIDLSTGTKRSLYEGNLDNAGFQLSVVVDATHVYWVRSVDPGGGPSEIWKRARCGGAAVRIGTHGFYANRLALLGDRVYLGSASGLWSLAK